ncbi:MAG TPA: hypothetical protein VIJ40_05475 [Acidimicrobiales bacterium]
MATLELSGMSIVFVGSFNPEVFQPSWLVEQGLLSKETANFASSATDKPLLVSANVTNFATDWFELQILRDRLVIATNDDSRKLELKDFAFGILTLLPETPVDAIGINTQAHFRADSAGAWNDFGDRFLPKDVWESILPEGPWKVRSGGLRVGMRTVVIEASRDETVSPGLVRMEVGPSALVEFGVYCAVNCHFGPPDGKSEPRESALHFSEILKDEWANAMSNSDQMIESIGASV